MTAFQAIPGAEEAVHLWGRGLKEGKPTLTRSFSLPLFPELKKQILASADFRVLRKHKTSSVLHVSILILLFKTFLLVVLS